MTTEKKTYVELAESLEDCPPWGSKWRHYKDDSPEYTVFGAVIKEDTLEPMVLYGEFGYLVFCRPLAEWKEMVLVDGRPVPRFRRVG